uniref:uncharacterized protein n=1 Tax=Centroberyx gerrardi TaxID=166262 RepID=UPI003AACD816
MEEESLCFSLPDIRDSAHQQPQRDSWSSAGHQHLNGQQEDIVWEETEAQRNETHRTEQLSPPPKGLQTAEEAENLWEQIVRPVTCTAAPLSCATVQWDVPDPSSETPSPMTDSSLANELDSGGATRLDTSHIDAELFLQEDTEKQDGLDSQMPPIPNVEWRGNVSEPCDSADVEEQTAQEKDDPAQAALEGSNEIPLGEDSEEEKGQAVTEDAVEAVESLCCPEEIQEDGADGESAVDLRLEEEQEKPGVLLTGQTDSENEPSSPSTNGVEMEEEDEEGSKADEEPTETDVSCNEECEEAKTIEISCPSDMELVGEPLQSDPTGPTVKPDQLINLQQSEQFQERCHSELLEQLPTEPTSQTEEPTICEDADETAQPEQSEVPEQPEDNEEPLIQEEENAEGTENSENKQEQTKQPSMQPLQSESKQLDETEKSEQTQHSLQEEMEHFEDPDRSGQPQHLDQSPHIEPTERSTQPEKAEQPAQCTQSEQIVSVEAEQTGVAEQPQQMEPAEQNEHSLQMTSLSPTPSACSLQPVEPDQTDQSEITEQLSPGTDVPQPTAEAGVTQVEKQADSSHQTEQVERAEDGSLQTVVANGEQPAETTETHMNGGGVDREMACRLAERLHKLDGIQPIDVVKHIDKDNDFSRAVGEEYLKFFDFTGQTLDQALRSFLKVVVLIGETQERERVLQQFSCRFHQCNPDSFPSAGAVLTLTCALMLLNTDLHGQNVGKAMSTSNFVSNLDGMNEGENFSKDLLKSFYTSIKTEPLEWAVDEKELMLPEENGKEDASLRSKSNPFQDVPHDRKAVVVKQGFLQRKVHADIDGKRTPWGKRSWKTFYGVLRGMVLYLQKDDYRKECQSTEEVVSVHHSLAEEAADYTKKPHVFRLQTADWRVFLFQASSKLEMCSWIDRINLVSALHSSPPFPAAVGSQRRFFRPILPASQSAHTLERQLQSHAGMLESFQADLAYLHESLPEGRRAKAKELEEHRVRAEYLQHETCRYEVYIRVLEAWKSLNKTADTVLDAAELDLFDKAMHTDSVDEMGEEGGVLQKSHSSPSLELEMAPPTVIKVRRNISERRTYRRTIIPRWNKEI